jgi:hypothetical protein
VHGALLHCCEPGTLAMVVLAQGLMALRVRL